MTNPFDDTATVSDDQFRDDFNLSGEKRERPIPPGFKVWDGGLITEPGAYIGVPISRYHGEEICDGPSISSTGLKKLSGGKAKRSKGMTPRHFYETSSLNPNRRPTEQTDALRLGQGFHDALLLPEEWAANWHRLPEGFSRAAKVKMAVEIAEADAAIAAGKCIVNVDEVARIDAMVAAMRADKMISALIAKGEPEVTLAWRDEATGVWCRARPDWMMETRRFGMNVKTDTDASYDGFSSSIGKYGYAQSAAFELEGYERVFGRRPEAYFHPVVEKPGAGWKPGDFIATALWQLPEEDIVRGQFLNRIGLRVFADCVKAGEWPSYTPNPDMCGIPGYLRKIIDDGGQGDGAEDAADDTDGA